MQNRNTNRTLSKIIKISLLAASMILLVPATALGNNQQPAPDLFDDFGIQQSTKKALPTKAVKGRNRSVNVRTDLLESDTLTLNLFDDVIVTAVRDRLIDNGKTYTWIGSVEGEQDSEVFLTIRGKTLSGNVQIGDKTYEIEPKGNNLHDITQVDPDKNPQHSKSKEPEEFLAAGGQIDTTATATSPTTSAATAGTIIDLLVVYTPKAKNNASGQAGIEAKISNAVAMANQAYLNSKIDMQLNLVGMAETNYVESGDMNTSLSALTGTGDGKMDEVHTLRNKLGADQVSLVTADTNYCGVAYIMSSSWVSSAFAPYAFSVVHDDSKFACLSSLTLAHELGHNQGDEHNKEDAAGSSGAYSYSYGHRLCQTGGFRTVMSYNCTGGTRVSYFSNPGVSLTTGEVTGTATANNAQSMNNTKGIVAAFRSSSTTTITTTTTLPTAPGSLSAATLSSSQIALKWSDNSSNETGFRIERSVDGINWGEIAVVGSNTVSFTDNGLNASTTYNYRVRAYNSNGNSSYSNIGKATTSTASTLPIAPSNLSAATVSSSQIALKWSDNSSNETGFRIERSVDSITWGEIAVAGSNTVSFTNSGLSASKTYYYRVRAYNNSGYSSYSNVGKATTSASDATAPSVKIMNPVSGAKVNGNVDVTVNASDNVGVKSMQLIIDGKVVISGNTSSLTYKWNTSKISRGTHTIKSTATDLSNNIGSTSISVTK